MRITGIYLCGDITGVVIHYVKIALKGIMGIGWIVGQRHVRPWFTKCPIRRMVPWKNDIEHADEGPFL